MKRLLLTALCGLFLAPASFAIVDTNNNGVSDPWEKQFNDGDLFHESFDPQSDPDADGWTNAQEAAAGTNPFNPSPPVGIIQPEIVQIPAATSEPDAEGEIDIISPEAITVAWPTIPGKQYTLLASIDLTQGNWLPVDTFIGDEAVAEVEYTFALTGADRLFWRVATDDIDSDGDGLTNAEETKLGLDPYDATADSDADGMPDSWEILHGLDPFDDSDGLLDPDGDGLTNAQEFSAGRDPKIYDVITHLERAWEFVESRVTETTQGDGTKQWEGKWSDDTSAPVRMAHEDFQHVLQQRDQQPYSGALENSGLLFESGIMWLHPDGRQPTNSSSDLTVSEPDVPTTRKTVYGVGKYNVRLARNIETGPKVLERYIVLIYPKLDMSEAPSTFPLELTIPENQRYSQTMEIKTDLPNALLGLLPVDITAAFGEGPDIPDGSNQTSRQLLENYLNVVKVARQGDVWAVNGKDKQGNNKIWGVEIVSDQAKLNAALSSSGRYVVFDGHSNYGFGPDFVGPGNINRVSDFTNYGARYTDVPLTFRKLLRNPQNPNDPTNFGAPYGNLEIPDGEFAVTPTNYKPLPINRERFPNIDGIGVGQAFQKQGQGFDTWHYRIAGGSKRLMIDAPKTDLPANRAYKTFFYNACSTGINYIENFKQGDFIYTDKDCRVHQGTKVFVQGVVEGKTTEQIIPLLNIPDVGGGAEGEIIYTFERF